MNAYLDTSVLLRIILRQPGRLRQWQQVEIGVASALVEVETLRTLDRLRLRGELTDEELAAARDATYALLRESYIVEPTRVVLSRASQPMPTPIGTLNALHLATALLWQETRDPELVVATHDSALGRAARAVGLQVVGV